jgi:hypothetical protein
VNLQLLSGAAGAMRLLGKPLVKRSVTEFAEILLKTLPSFDAGQPAEKATLILQSRAEASIISFAR